jgi:prepilin signal peptidase PulO-like enzyme (type II secretory pathway)
MFEYIIVALIGLLVGGIVNALADELPYRSYLVVPYEPDENASKEEKEEYEHFRPILYARNRRGLTPAYADGTLRPVTAWLGLSAFLLGQREPVHPQPDEIRARPHHESSELSWRHPLTEIMSVIFFVLAAMTAPHIDGMNMAQYLLNFVYMALFALIIVIDIEHKLILFVVMIPAIIVALMDAWLVPEPYPSIVDSLIGCGVGFGFFFLIYLFGFVFRWVMGKVRGQKINTVAFGYGDVMMISFSGAMLGLLPTLLAIFITLMLGFVGALLFMVGRRIVSGRYDAFTAIPYGPYIVIATMTMQLWGTQVSNFLY